MQFDMTLLFLGITTIFVSLCVIPPLAKVTIAPLLGSAVAKATKAYLQPSIELFYNLWTGLISLEKIALQPTFLHELRMSLPFPIELSHVSIASLQLQLPALVGGEGPMRYKASIEVTGLRVRGTFVGNYELDRAEYLERITANKIAMANAMTQAVQSYLGRKPDAPAEPSTFKSRLMHSIAETIVISFRDVEIEFVGEEPAAPTTPLSIECSELSLKSAPTTEEEQINHRTVTLRNFYISIDGHRVVGTPSLIVDVTMPYVFEVMLSPLPLAAKKLGLSITPSDFVTTLSPHLYLMLIRYYIPYVKYGLFQEHLAQVVTGDCAGATPEEEAAYCSALKWDLATQAPVANGTVTELEKRLTLEQLVDLRAKALKWAEHHADISPMALVAKVQAENAPFRDKHIVVALDHWTVHLFETGLAEPAVAVLALSDLSVNMRQFAAGDVAMELEYGIRDVQLTTSYPSMECARSQILSHASDTALLYGQLKQTFAGAMDLGVTLEKLSIFAAKDPLQYFLLYLDRLRSSAQEYMAAALPATEAAPAPAVVADTAAPATTLNLSNVGPCSLFKGADMKVTVRVADLSVFLIPPVVDNTGALLEFTITTALDLDSSLEREKLSLVVSEAGLLPRLYQPNDDRECFPTIFSPQASSTQSLLAPIHIANGYELVMASPTTFTQRLSVSVSDIALSFSQLNFAMFWSSLMSLSEIQTTTPEQLRKRLAAQEAAQEAEMAFQLQARLDQAQKQFEKIDVDHTKSIELDELELLLAHAIVEHKLLKRELQELTATVFNTIDKDGSGTIDFDEFRHYLLETMNVEHLRGYVDLYACEYDATDVVESFFGKLKPSTKAEDWPLFFGTRAATDPLTKFWSTYELEMGVTKDSRNGQPPALLQRKLVRLLQHNDAARGCWEVLIAPNLAHDSDVDLSWALTDDTPCGGIVEFESAAKMILNQASVPVTEAVPEATAPAPLLNAATLSLQSDIKLGTLHVVLLDDKLPLNACRADLVVDHIKCQVALASSIGPDVYNMNAVGSEWSMALGLQVAASCYSDLSYQMEAIIEPWVCLVGVKSVAGVEGMRCWLEAEKRFQVNVSSSLLEVMLIIPEIMSGTLVVEDAPKVVYRLDEPPFHVTNMTGVPLRFESGGRSVLLEPRSVQALDGLDAADCRVEIPEWGALAGISLPAFGPKELVVQDASGQHYITLNALCRLEDPKDASLVLKSNVVVTNLSSLDMEMQTLVHLAGFTSLNDKVLTLPSTEQVAMPISLFMGDTEVYLRGAGSKSWHVNVTLTNDMLLDNQTPPKPEGKVEAVAKKGTIVPLNQKHKSSKLVKQLTPSILLNKHVLTDNTVQWELALLPSFAILNALPYALDYMFLEYRTNKSAGRMDMAGIQKLLEESSVHGTVASGATGEVPGLSSQTPGYMAFRLRNGDATSAWSKPLLMAIHATVELFTTAPEKYELEPHLAVNFERLTMPDKPRVVKFSAPYWVVNKTGLTLAYRLPDAEAAAKDGDVGLHPHFQTPIMLHAPKARMSFRALEAASAMPPSWSPLVNSSPDYAASTPPPVFHQLSAASTWSEPMNASAVQTNGEVYSSGHVLGVDIQGLQGLFVDSVLVTLTPRYIVQNHTPFDIQLRAFATPQTDHLNELAGVGSCPAYGLASHANGVLYAFSPLSKEPLAKCQKYFSMALAGSHVWSSILSVNTVGDVYFPLECTIRKRGFIVKASIQLLGTHLFVVLTDASAYPPYGVENYTMYPVTLHQGSNLTAQTTTLARAERLAFAWDQAYATEHRLDVVIQGQKFAVDIDSVGPVKAGSDLNLLKFMDSDTGKKFLLEVVPVGSTRVLRIVDAKSKHLDMLRSAKSKSEGTARAVTASLYTTALDLRLAGVGISFMDALPQEVLYLSLDDLRVQSPPESLEWDVSIYHLQVDNMLPNTRFPVILAPVDSGFNGANNVPFFKLVIETLGDNASILKVMDVAWQPVHVRVDIDYVFKLLGLLEPLLAAEATLQAQLELAADLFAKPIPVPTPVVNSKLLYFETFSLHETQFRLECLIQKEDIARSKAMAHSRSWLVNALMQLIGIVGSKLSGSPSFYFSEITKRHCFTTQDRLVSQLIQNYSRDVVMQAYKLVGSIDMLGNPVGLVEDLGSGIKAFLKVTTNEVLGDSQTRGEGVKILGKTVAKSGTGVLAKMTGSLDKLMDEVSDVADTPHDDPDAPKDALGGGLQFAKNLGKGLTGIITKPVEGAISGGVTGFVQGAVQGLAGAPVVLLKTVTSTAHTLAVEASETLEDVVPFQGRRRKELQFVGKALVPPAKQPPSMLHVEVLSASGLVASSGQCNPVCYMLLNDKVVLQTKCLFGTANPEWRMQKNIELKTELASTSVVFKVRDSFTGFESTIGQFRLPLNQLLLDFEQLPGRSPLSQWVKGQDVDLDVMAVDPPRIEKEYTLWGKPKKSREGKPPTLQVLVTVVDLVNYVPPKNMFGSTPNLAPYIGVELGGKAQKTTALKAATAAMSWKETLTFDWKSPEKYKTVVFTLYDKSMLVDETLGAAALTLDTTGPRMDSLLDVRVNGAVNGQLHVKTEILGLPDDDEGEPSPTQGDPTSKTAGKLKLHVSFS
ncbi:hypothetical protein ACHHYP_07939 [Achlya hypogyna]|uniref:Uncharacterized protein n=1 Tax=Achlya hypogyna TaxID=1202772 RepID=A0A1V9YQB4_ACHHY|nr:hypothetical protein ACHHYP_07939 [Achlya hypogyna]